MHLSSGLTITLVALTSARNIPRELEARSDVEICKGVLIALKASAFCSGFVPIKDIISTAIVPGSPIPTTITVCNDVAKRHYSTSSRTTSRSSLKTKKTTTSLVSRTSSRKSSITSTKSRTSSATSKSSAPGTKCNVGSAQLNQFACQVIAEACVAYVRPKTATVGC